PPVPATGFNFTDGSHPVGGIGIFSDSVNAGVDAPWYLINSEQMRFACAAILAPKPRALKAGEVMELHYRIAIRRDPWTPESLRAAQAGWLNASPGAGYK